MHIFQIDRDSYITADITATKPAWQEGLLFWDKENHTYAIYNDQSDVTLQIGQETLEQIYAGENILNGDAVTLSGSHLTYPIGYKAISDGVTAKYNVAGVATQNITSGSKGYVTIQGRVNDVDTSAYPAGSALYLSNTVPGRYMVVPPPEPSVATVIGYCLHQNATTGKMLVNISLTPEPVHPYIGMLTTPTISIVGHVVTIGSGTVALSSTADGLGAIKAYTVPAKSFTVTSTFLDSQYIVAIYNGGSPIYNIVTTTDEIDNIQSTAVYTITVGAGGTLSYVSWDAPGVLLANKLFTRINNVNGIERETGLVLGETSPRRITVTSGSAWQGVQEISLPAVNSATNRFVLVFHSGSNAFSSSLTTQYNNTQYDDGTRLRSLTGNRFTVNWVYRGIGNLNTTVVMLGTEYNQFTDAVAAQPPAPPSELRNIAVLVGRAIYQQNNAAATQIDSAFTQTFTPAGITDHNLLNNLQGGTANQYYHLTAAEYGNTSSGSFVRRTGSVSNAISASYARSASWAPGGSSGEPKRIINGSVSASISPAGGLQVNTSASFDGDVLITGYIVNTKTPPANTNLLGYQAGLSASSTAIYSNFIGYRAGSFASGSIYGANFIGFGAGRRATNAETSNFIGFDAGNRATNAVNSNFIGASAGIDAANAANSNFIGWWAGLGAINAAYSNFIGDQAGWHSEGATVSNFVGQNAGYSASYAHHSNFIGAAAGNQAVYAVNSNFVGAGAGNQAANANNSNFIGTQAGESATNAENSNFIGTWAGINASGASFSNFMGNSAGINAVSATNSNFVGQNAGSQATSAHDSNFIGSAAGMWGTNAYESNFIGVSAGSGATNANNSNFIGYSAGQDSVDAAYSNFIGRYAGVNAPKANNSIFIGYSAGYADTVDNSAIGKSSILIGDYTSTGGNSNSIAIGQGVQNTLPEQVSIGNVLFATGIYTGTTTTGSVQSNGRVGIRVSNPVNALDVAGNISATIVSASLFAGTASYAKQARSASWAPGGGSTLHTASTYPITSSWARNAQSASFSSYSSDSDKLDGQHGAYFQKALRTGSTYPITSSWTNRVISSSYAATSSLVKGTAVINKWIQLLPVNSVDMPLNTTASYIYCSGSTNDLWFTEYDDLDGRHTTRLSWMVSNLYTGILYGGVLSTTPGSTTFNVTAGQGIVVDQDASLTTTADPNVKLIKWAAQNNVPITNRLTSRITYVGIDGNGALVQQTAPWGSTDINQHDTQIELGSILTLSGSVSTGAITKPQVSYGYPQKVDDFVRAFGPIKLSGHTLLSSGSGVTLRIRQTAGTSFSDGSGYTTNPNHASVVTENAVNTSKIYRYYYSGSTEMYDTGVAGAGYTTIDNTRYVNTATGQLTTNNATNRWSIQRVFWIPNSPAQAFLVYYGNAIYTSLLNAQNAISTEPFSEFPSTANDGIFLGHIVIRGGAGASLNNTTDSIIMQSGIFRSISGVAGTGATATPTLATLSDVAIATPSIGDILVYGAAGGSQWNNSKTLTGNYIVSGSVTATGTIRGNGTVRTASTYPITSSWARNALSASWAPSSGGGGGGSTLRTGSSYPITSSWARNAVSASYAPQNNSPTTRTVLLGTRTYYVSTTGNDSNNGLTVGAPFATLQKAMDTVSSIDTGIYDVTIQLADGTYAQSVNLSNIVGQGRVIFNGNSGTPANVILAGSAVAGKNTIYAQNVFGKFVFQNMEIRSTTQHAIYAAGPYTTIATGAGIRFGSLPAGFLHVAALFGANVQLGGSYTIVAGGLGHMYASNSATIRADGGWTVTLVGTPAFTSWFCADDTFAVIYAPGLSFVGTATGQRYNANSFAIINSGGGGATYFPGSVGGTANVDGRYY